MKNITQLKPTVHITAEKMNKTYQDALNKRNGNVTFRALPPSDIKQYIDLTNYNYQDDLDKYIDDLLLGMYEMMQARSHVQDNYIPQFNINLGIADYVTFISGDIHFKPDTSWSFPVVGQLGMERSLPEWGSAVWYKKYMYILEGLLKRTEHTDIPFVRGFFSPLDLAEALHGADIYTDFYDNPDQLHDLLEYCADATIFFAKDIYNMIKKYRKNSTYGRMFVDDTVNMSEDIASMISPELYNEFCAPHSQKVINTFGSGHMHSHSCAIHLVKQICSMDNVANLWLATDPGHPRPMEILDRIIEDANSTCLAIDCNSFEEIEKNIDTLRKGNFSVCLPVDSLEEAVHYTEMFEKL